MEKKVLRLLILALCATLPLVLVGCGSIAESRPMQASLINRDACELVVQPSELPASFDIAHLVKTDLSSDYFPESFHVHSDLSQLCVIDYEASQYSARILHLQSAILVYESEEQAKRALQEIVAQRQEMPETRGSVARLGDESYYSGFSLFGMFEFGTLQWRYGTVIAEITMRDSQEKPSAAQLERLARRVQKRLQ